MELGELVRQIRKLQRRGEAERDLVFQGTLQFNAWKHGAVGRTLKVQQMHTLNHSKLAGTPLGTYTSPDCVISIGGIVYPSRWMP